MINSCAVLWFGAGASIGIVGYKYIEGQLEITYTKPYDQVYNAAKKSLIDSKIIILKEYKSLSDAKLVKNQMGEQFK